MAIIESYEATFLHDTHTSVYFTVKIMISCWRSSTHVQ